jgi:hypothetical protein
MIIGNVNADLEAIVQLVVLGSRQLEIQGVVGGLVTITALS